MGSYPDELNSVQQQAIMCKDGPIMVIAGAGSGKTRVLTYRIAQLIKTQVNPFSILALTFTNKAAREMKERVVQIVGGTDAQNVWIGTFHSIFARILRIEADKLGYPSNFTIYDTIDSKNQIKAIIKEYGLDDKVYKPGLVLNRISLSKNNLITPLLYSEDITIQKEDQQSNKPRLGEIYQTYVNRCFKAGVMDFDDLLYNMNYLLTEIPEILHKYQHKFQYVLIDEFQDTNLLQYTIVKKLAALNENICVVGDDAQSIYAFRGANIQNILNFQKDYQDLQVYKLEQNYRSTKNIINAANCVIKKNNQQLHKEVWTHNEEGELLTVLKALTDNEEGRQVAHSIFDSKVNNQLFNKDFAILYRTNAQSRAMEEALRKINIPYRIYGGLSFYQRKEVKDLLAYFRLTINNKDEESLKRVINYPARGIGNRTVEKIMVAAEETDRSMWETMANLKKHPISISSAAESKVLDFVSTIKSYSFQAGTENAYKLAELIASSSGILKDLYDSQSPEALSKYENLQELLNGIKEFAENWHENNLEGEPDDFTGPSLSDFLQDIELLTDADVGDPNDNDKVSLMTIHAAKGLEFPFVYIVGLEENLFPSQLAVNSRSEIEEERRLFYVALTRARKKVFLSYATSRYRWGNLIYCEPSRFMEEIDSKYLSFPDSLDGPPMNRGPQRSINWFRKKPKSTKTTHGHTPSPLKKSLVRLHKVAKKDNQDFEYDDTKSLQVGMEVEHQRFGFGKVLHIEGVMPNQKAIVFFSAAGQKQLLLKYAKLKIIGN